MKYLFSMFFIFVVMFSGINVGFSADFDCCYDGTTVRPMADGACVGEGKTALSGISSYDQCKLIKDTRLSCKKSGIEYCTAAGEMIFDNIQIKNLFSTVCDGGFGTYISGSCDNTPVISEPGSGETNPGENGGSDPGIENPYSDDELDVLNFKCSDGGGFLGLFSNKQSCNSVILSGDNHCVFNPYLGSNFNSKLLNLGSKGVVDFESESCIVDKALRSCSDLKIESLCGGVDSSEIAYLDGKCTWIESDKFELSEYLGGVDVGGICISKEVSETTYFNSWDFNFKKNVLENPGFENYGGHWSTASGSNIISNPKLSHYGNNFVNLDSNSYVVQDVGNLSMDLTYQLTFFMRATNFSSTGGVEVYYGGTKIGSTFNLKSLNSEIYGLYKIKVVNFKPMVSEGQLKILYAGLGDVHIDSISLKVNDILSPETDSSEIFSPLNILPKDASNCGLCFTDLGFNFCTQNKSDLLGACSYMVKSPNETYGANVDMTKYLGSDSEFGNKLLFEKPWQSQSLANSQLFCELYTSESQCLYSSNYVNSKFSNLHPNSDSTLCKWSPVDGVGCFKDSDGNDEFDTINNYANVLGSPVEDYKYSDADYYARDLSFLSDLKPELKVSDFQLACDILPPNTHVSLTGKDTDGETIFMNLNSDGSIIGDVYLEVSVSDLLLDGCEDYNFKNILYVEYYLNNGKNLTIEVVSNQYNQNSIKIDEFLVDLGGNSLLDGATSLIVKVIDQSGNVGKTWEFDLNIDNLGPQINLLSPTTTRYGLDYDIDNTIVGLNQNLSFEFIDNTIIDYCSYNLISIDGADSSYFTDSGFIFENGTLGTIFKNFTLPITNSSSSGDGYLLAIECVDIFNQSTISSITFGIDLDTRITLVSPKSFRSELFFDGFLNETTQVVLVSSDSKLDTCELVGFNNLKSGLAPLVVETYDSTIHNNSIGSMSDSDIKSIVIGEIGFSSDGIYAGKYSCKDTLGNTFFEEHTYYYDTVSPELVSFDILEDNSSKFVDSVTGDIYLRGDDNPIYNLNVNLSVNGTGSWIDYSFSTLSNLGADNGTLSGAWFNRAELLNYTFVSEMILEVNVDKTLSPGIEVLNQSGLREISFSVNLTDKAGNVGSGNFSYFYDTSIPTLTFSGDIVDLDSTDDLIFSRVSDPNVIVSFSAPSYREFTCSVVLMRNGQKSLEGVYPSGGYFEFKISDLDSRGWFAGGEWVEVVVMCEDIFGETLNEEFTLIYDNTPLMLNEFGLVLGEDIYSRINTDYTPLKDSLYFNFNDTNELGGYMCSFKFNKIDANYDCSTNFTKLNQFDSLYYESSIKSIISGYGITNLADESNYFCDRTSAFASFESSAFRAEIDYLTNLELEVLCMDGAGFNVSAKVPINYTYLSGGLISFDYEYVGLDKVKFIVTSLVDYSDIVISFTDDGFAELTKMSSADSKGDGTFVYTSLDYSIEDIIEGESILYAVAFDYGLVDGFLSTDFYVDKTLPIGNLSIQDLNENGEIFDNIFKLNINVTDEVSGLDYVNLFVNGEVIAYFSESNFTLFNNSYGIELGAFSNALFFNSGKSLDVDLLFGEAILGEKYTFEMVVVDNVGRELYQEITVKYSDGIYLDLIDSTNAVVYNKGYGWLTKSISPILKFETSKDVTCKMTSTKGGFVLLGGTGTEFSFDLSATVGFNLSELGDEVDFNLECSNFESTYKFTKTLYLNDDLLDYVLLPLDGFLVNEKPYLISAQIRSVGPFSKMTCSYSFGGNTFEAEIVGGYENIELNFTGLSTGLVNLDINCIDSIGNFGPSKQYVFDVQVDGPLILDESSLVLKSSDGFESVLDGSNELFIHSTSGVDLSFNLNKKGIEYCQYGIDPVGGVLSGFVNFFRGLFNVDRYDVVSSTPYEFTVSGLTFTNPFSELDILCYDDIGGRFSETYMVNYFDGDVVVDAQRVSQ